MFKKWMTLGMILAVVAVSAFAVSPAFAQEDDPITPTRGNRGVVSQSLNLVHDYLIDFVVAQTGLSAEEIEAQLDAGLTLSDIVDVDDFQAFMDEARVYVAAQLEEDGLSIPGWAATPRGNRNQSAGNGVGGYGTGDGTGTGIAPEDGTGNQYGNPDNGYGDGTGTGIAPEDGTGNQYGNPGNGGDGTCDPTTCTPLNDGQGNQGGGMGNPNR